MSDYSPKSYDVILSKFTAPSELIGFKQLFHVITIDGLPELGVKGLVERNQKQEAEAKYFGSEIIKYTKGERHEPKQRLDLYYLHLDESRLMYLGESVCAILENPYGLDTPPKVVVNYFPDILELIFKHDDLRQQHETRIEEYDRKFLDQFMIA